MIQLDVNSDSLPLQPRLPPAKPQGPGGTWEMSDEAECPRERCMTSSRHAVVDFCDIVCPVSMDLDRHYLAKIKGLARGGLGLLSALPGEEDVSALGSLASLHNGLSWLEVCVCWHPD